MTKWARIIAAGLAVLMLASVCAGLISAVVYAAELEADDITLTEVLNASGSKTTYISSGNTYTIKLSFYVDAEPVPSSTHSPIRNVNVNNSVWRWSSPHVTWSSSAQGNNRWLVDITLTGIRYNSTTGGNRLDVTVLGFLNAGADDLRIEYDFDSSYFNRYSSGDGDGSYETNPYSSNIVIENVLIRDADDLTVDRIDKDTPPFTIDIVYADFGLREADDDVIDSAEMDAYMLETGGFIPSQGTKGTIRPILRGSNDVPRFRATFSGVTWDETSSYITFRVQYVIEGWYVDGESSARVYAARTEDEEDEDEVAPPTPYIIISRYDIGGDAIEAGASFTLSVNFANTSDEIDLENIVMTVSPIATSATEGTVPLSIASASNTYYYTGLPASGNISQSIDLNVKPDSSVGSAGVQIAFDYEYVVDKTREKNGTSVDIAIPITQIDRFAVDPITNYDSWMQTGSEGWVEVSFVNRGKSTTYNISGYVLNPDGTAGQTEHFGNLNAGENGTLDFSPIFYEPGEQTVTIVIQYEDENAEIKELSESYVCTVEEPWYGGWEVEDPGMWVDEEPEAEGVPTWKTVLLVVGGLAIAAPIALYVTMRVRVKGSEEFDEDF